MRKQATHLGLLKMNNEKFDEGFEYGFTVAIGKALGAVNNIDISDGKLNALGMKILITKSLEEIRDKGYAS